MKATGIVRRIDDLGRVVIPKEIRRTLRIREGDPLEIFVDHDGEVILKKYSPIGELGHFAQEYANSLHEALGHIACIADRDNIIAVAGATKTKEFLNQPIGPVVEKVTDDRRPALINATGEHLLGKECPVYVEEGENCDLTATVIAPIVAAGDPIGAVVMCSKEPGAKMGNMELKLAETAASFLAKQLEQ
ncbi:MAG: stage V sporulation protein T [Clostridia bacterium]|nr:MAG: stage V sporulation protein T [Clostridia bacterium]